LAVPLKLNKNPMKNVNRSSEISLIYER